jgi:predicted RNA-binding Zn ribbon-like protein
MPGEWILDSAFPSVNFLNTLRDRYLGGRELLGTPKDLASWLVLAGLADQPPEVTDGQLAEALHLRETIDAVLLAAGRGTTPPASAVGALNAAATAAPRAVAQLKITEEGLTDVYQVLPGEPASAALATLAADAVERAAEGADVRECAAPDCSIRFVDLSPARNKQWCSMSRCGNRVKARKHYRRSLTRQDGAEG